MWVKHQCRKKYNFFIIIPISRKQRQRNWSKIFHITLINFHSFFMYFLVLAWFVYVEIFILELHHCLKLFTALSRSTTRSFDHLNLVFESVPAAATCSLAILFFIELFRIRILLIFCCFFINLRMH